VPRLARGVASLGTESAFAVLARARELERLGRSIVHLEIGEPDFPTPEHVAAACIAAIQRGETGYTQSAGLIEFREVSATELARSREIEVAAERVLVANGAKLLLFLTILAVCDPGDEVIYPDPGFLSTSPRSGGPEASQSRCRFARSSTSASRWRT
jgi:aspartate aminotransferase